MDELPLVSICIPVYNGEKFLEKTLTSIRNQTYPKIEVIVLDNASTDSTPMIIKKYEDARIKYFRNETTIKAAENWTKAVGLTRGDLIAIYHADDLYEPNIVEEQVKFMTAHPEVGVVFSEAKKINSTDQEIGQILLPKGMANKGGIFSLQSILLQLVRNNYDPLVCPTAMARRSVYAKTLPYNNKEYKYVFDVDMYLRIAEISKIGVIEAPLIRYRIHQNQGSFQYSKEVVDHNEFYDLIDKFIKLHGDLLNQNDLDRYDAFKRWDYAVHSMKAFGAGNDQKAKELSGRVLSLKMILTSLTYPPLLMRLAVIIGLKVSVLFGLGRQYSLAYMRNKTAYFK